MTKNEDNDINATDFVRDFEFKNVAKREFGLLKCSNGTTFSPIKRIVFHSQFSIHKKIEKLLFAFNRISHVRNTIKPHTYTLRPCRMSRTICTLTNPNRNRTYGFLDGVSNGSAYNGDRRERREENRNMEHAAVCKLYCVFWSRNPVYQ